VGAIFAGIFGAGTGGGSILASIAAALFKTLLDGIFGAVDKHNQDVAHEELGASRVVAKQNKETADVERKQAQIALDYPDLAGTIDALERGVF
jgi:D-arabinose 1-dehydrogenase-like Zn-dependent alcohol dehydrogenase